MRSPIFSAASGGSRLLPLAASIALFAANWYTCRRLFTAEFLPHMHSIEGSYIALTRYTMENWGDLGWFPLWYSGMPFQNAYQPGLHLLAAALGSLFGLTPALAYHFTIATLYCLGPVFLFLLAWRMTGALGPSFAAGLLYSLWSPSALLMPIVESDLGGIWYARRYMALVYYGEGPNVGGLTFVPLALLGLHAVYRGGPPIAWLGTAAALGAMVLISLPAAVVMTMAVLAYLLARPAGEALRRLPALALLAVGAYALIAPWTPPSTMRVNQANAQVIGGDYPWTKAHILYWGAVFAGLLLLRLILSRRKTPWTIQFAAAFAWLSGAVTLVAVWFDIYLMPQPERFHIGMEMALILLLVLSVNFLLRRGWLRWGVCLLLAIFVFHQLGAYRFYNKGLTREIDITETVEYRLARWLDENMAGQRVYAPGTVAFWMNIWTDTPQMTGCCLPGMPNWTNAVASYIITSGEGAQSREAELALLWLKAFGAQAVATGGPESREHYHDFVHPYKFEGLLPLLWREDDDRLYAVPQRSASLARVVGRGHIVARRPENGIDIEPLLPYVAALDDPALPLAEYRRLAPSRAVIQADLAPDHVLSIQQTYHPGWSALVNGEPRPLQPDGLGLTVLEPGCSGPCTVELSYDGGLEMRLARAASALGLLGFLLAAARPLWSNRRKV